MSPITLGIVSGLYAMTAIDQIFKGEYYWALAWFCYALANVALIQEMR